MHGFCSFCSENEILFLFLDWSVHNVEGRQPLALFADLRAKFLPTSMGTLRKTSTTAGSNCVPEQR